MEEEKVKTEVKAPVEKGKKEVHTGKHRNDIGVIIKPISVCDQEIYDWKMVIARISGSPPLWRRQRPDAEHAD